MKLQYRSDIDGLRAIAVLTVIFYHLGIPGFAGGFVGVDIFFVISGFLITSILQKEINEGGFSIARFYERRIRRIFPALYPVLLFCFIVGVYLFDVKQFSDLALSLGATAFFWSNVLFLHSSGDYFGAPSSQLPLLHTWSLAVEEQFYIVFPLFLVAINRYFKKDYIVWIFAAALISIAASSYGVYISKTATFYLAPTRAWEFLAGTILALQAIPLVKSNWVNNLLSVLGMVLICFSIVFFNEKTLFPGVIAIVPVFGAALIIYSGQSVEGYISRFLSLKPLVFIGLISYSLYLWHWPLLVFMKYYLMRELHFIEVACLILMTFIAAYLSWQFIEKPFRVKPPLLANRRLLFAVSGILMVFAYVTGKIVWYKNGFPERFIDNSTIFEVQSDPIYYKHDAWKGGEYVSEHINAMRLGNQNSSPSFLLLGDSHAQALSCGISSLALRSGIAGYIIFRGGIPPILSTNPINEKSGYSSLEYHDLIKFLILHREIKTIIIACSWEGYTKNRGFELQLESTVSQLLRLNREVVLVADVPRMKYDIPHAMFVAYRTNRKLNCILPSPISALLPTRAQYYERNKESSNIFMSLATNKKVRIVYPDTMLYENGYYQVYRNNKLYYIDDSHLSSVGSCYVSTVFAPIFRTGILNAL